jgi:hypothetical protein
VRAPSPTTFVTAAPTATVEPKLLVVVDEQNVVGSEDGGAMGVGFVINKGTIAVHDVEVTVSVRDSAGRVAASGKSTLVLPVLVPGARTPFIAPIENAPTEVTKPTFLVRANPASESEVASFARTLRSHDVRIHPAGPGQAWARVAGKLTNVGDKPVTKAFVLVSALDASLHIIDLSRAEASADRLLPGATTEFEADLQGLRDVSNVSVTTGGTVAD